MSQRIHELKLAEKNLKKAMKANRDAIASEEKATAIFQGLVKSRDADIDIAEKKLAKAVFSARAVLANFPEKSANHEKLSKQVADMVKAHAVIKSITIQK